MDSASFQAGNDEDRLPINSTFGTRKRACDACRVKKVRCNQEEPSCQNCVGWKIPCTYSNKKKRVAQNPVSKSLEDVDVRLARLEERMEEQMNYLTDFVHGQVGVPDLKSSGTTPDKTPIAMAYPATQSLPSALITDENGKTHFVGVNSILQLISQAEGDVNAKTPPTANAVATTPSKHFSLDLEQPLKAQLLADDVFSEMSIANSKTSTMSIEQNEAIKYCRVYFQLMNQFFPLFDEEIFFANVRETYRNETRLKDQAWFVCFNLVLVFGMSFEPSGRDLPLLQQLCTEAWRLLSTYPCWPSSLLKVQALVAGAYIAQELSRPGLVWSLISAASHEAQAMGLQRDCDHSQTLTTAEIRDRKIAFWGLFVFDRSLSLIFGRAFSLPDYDIDVGYPSIGKDVWWPSFEAWIQLAKIQGEIFQELYSAKGLRSNMIDRQTRVRTFDKKLRQWWKELGEGAFSNYHASKSSQLSYAILELEFNYHNTLVMLHRITSNTKSTDGRDPVRVLEARLAISAIEAAITADPTLNDNQVLAWLVLFYPFASFFTIFSYVVETPSASSVPMDLALLDFVLNLLANPIYQNPGAQRLHRVANVFVDVARTVTETAAPRSNAGSDKKRSVPNANNNPEPKRTRRPLNEELVTNHATIDLQNLELAYPNATALNTFPWEVRLPPQAPVTICSSDNSADFLSTGVQDGYDTLHDLQDDESMMQSNLNSFDWMMWDQGLMWPMNLE